MSCSCDCGWFTQSLDSPKVPQPVHFVNWLYWTLLVLVDASNLKDYNIILVRELLAFLATISRSTHLLKLLGPVENWLVFPSFLANKCGFGLFTVNCQTLVVRVLEACTLNCNVRNACEGSMILNICSFILLCM